jgi:glycosyltransferase involved in cell wall biosynthesis
MRIGIEAQRIFRPKKHGMEVVAMELIRQIQQLDTTNEYVLFAKDDTDRNCIQPTDRLTIQTIPSATYADWEQFRLPVAVKRSRLDLLHCTCNTAPLYPGAPLLLTLHDIIYLERTDFKGTAYQNFGNLYRRWIVPKIVNRSLAVITVSEFEKNTILERLRLPEEKVRVVHNAVHPRFHHRYSAEEVAALRQKYQLPEDFVLFLGNTAPKKNTANTIRAFSDHCENQPNSIPLVILDYDKSLVEAALEKSGRRHLLPRFIFPGYISSTEMPLLYNAATLFLYPSLRESFGLPLLEAMGCGTPVITSRTSSMPEIAGDAAILVDPYQVPELSAAITSLLADKTLREEYRQKGIARAARFTWEASARKLLAIYSEFL